MKMKSLLMALMTALLLCGPALAETVWLTSWDEASAQSKKSGKPILMDFTGSDWCGWCMKLEAEVFETSTFKDWATKNVVLLKLDFPNDIEQPPALVAQNQGLARRFGVRGYPTIVFADHEGNALGRYGYDKGGPENWTKKAAEILAQ